MDSKLQLEKNNRRRHASFQIFVRNLKGQTLALDVKASDTVKDLKNLIKEKENIPCESQKLSLGGRCLSDHLSLTNCEINHGSTLDFSLRLNGGKMLLDLFEFNNLKKQVYLNFSDSGPDYRCPKKGLNLHGVCTTLSCTAFKKNVIVPFGLGVFFLNKVITEANCPKCLQVVNNVNNLGFFDCMFTVTGMTAEGRKVSFESNKAPSNKYLTFDESESSIIKWRYIEVITWFR
eukprot:TRINITY_DN9490_c0_g1_i1.p1 TRINITY_DN9490_c0_g1~~TRINITY_DN9490_c0_g1_i1.p1  ORF type:complete len:233 (+),score=8.12 TRINITY_DN9490_c0_g1_i1:103-801(+)